MDVIETILMLVLSIGMRGKAHSWLEDPDDVRASSFFYSLIRMTPVICRVTKLLRVQCVCNILVIYCRQRTNRLKSCNFVVIFYFFLSLSLLIFLPFGSFFAKGQIDVVIADWSDSNHLPSAMSKIQFFFSSLFKSPVSKCSCVTSTLIKDMPCSHAASCVTQLRLLSSRFPCVSD